jgi:hypothetical protein
VGNLTGKAPVSVGRRALTPETPMDWAFVKVVKTGGEGWRPPSGHMAGCPGINHAKPMT